jgi:hypothetical protein
MSKPESYLESVRTANAELHQLELDIAYDIAAARNAGVTWQAIGDALTITKQAAQQKYGHKDHWTAANTAAGRTPSMFSDS